MLAGRGGKRGQQGLGMGPKMGQLTLSMGPARAEVCSYVQRATILSKRVAHILNTCKYHACKNNNTCLVQKVNYIFSPFHVKSTPHDGETEHAFILAQWTVRLTVYSLDDS